MLDEGKDVRNMEVPEYPSQFYWDVREGHDTVVNRYEQSLQELRHQPWLEQILGIGGVASSGTPASRSDSPQVPHGEIQPPPRP
jgi:hypothetical protein